MNLTAFSMPGCTLYTNWLLPLGLTNLGNTALWTVPIPFNGGLVGASIYVQGAVTSPGTNPVGAVMSNAIEVKFGWR